MPHDSLLTQLETAAHAPIALNHPMSQECTYRLGGPAKYFCAPETLEGLRACLLLCREQNLPVVLVGGGANLVFKDEGFPGLAIGFKNLNNFSPLPGGTVRVQAGLSNTELTAQTVKHGLSGFEWATGLPGTIGGGVYMNAKCYGASFSDIVLEARVLTPEGEWKIFTNAECQFDYKHSIFQTRPYAIVEVLLALKPGQDDAIRARTCEIQADRENKGQFLYPSAGCVFKNDYSCGTPTGALIEACGLKGRQIGGVRVFEQHANFLVNVGAGKTQDVLDLMDLIAKEVWTQQHIRLQPEIRIVP